MAKNQLRSKRAYSELAQWRLSMGYSIDQIAKALGIHRMTWIRYERSDSYPDRLFPMLAALPRKDSEAPVQPGE